MQVTSFYIAAWTKQQEIMNQIVSVKIHSAIGIARVGNSPSEFFIGPEKLRVHFRPSAYLQGNSVRRGGCVGDCSVDLGRARGQCSYILVNT